MKKNILVNYPSGSVMGTEGLVVEVLRRLEAGTSVTYWMEQVESPGPSTGQMEHQKPLLREVQGGKVICKTLPLSSHHRVG